jgi:hypothetical protein
MILHAIAKTISGNPAIIMGHAPTTITGPLDLS